MDGQRGSSIAPSQTRNSKKSKPRWECQTVRRIAVPIHQADWELLLATIARQMYDWSYQLPGSPPFKASSFIHPRTEIPTHPSPSTPGRNGMRDEFDKCEESNALKRPA